jgi:hypothetical protein
MLAAKITILVIFLFFSSKEYKNENEPPIIKNPKLVTFKKYDQVLNF